MDVAAARKALAPLLERYHQNKDNPTFTGNEKQVCQSLIVPFVRLVLGWDTEDPSEFHAEESRGGKRIDYVVYNKGISQFIIETKAPDRDIFEDRAAYKQALDYGYSKDKDFSILTNFRQVVILGSKSSYRVPEEAEIARIDLLDASDKDLELLLSFEKSYWLTFGKENRLYTKLIHHKPQIPVDERLLEDMKHWREQLLRNLKKNHPTWNFQDEREFMHIEEEVQKFIDRLIFVCFCEDKELNEPQLKSLMDEKKSDRFFSKPGWLLGKIQEAVRHYADRYDSDLFDRSLADEFKIDDGKLVELLRDLREPPQRPAYDFKSIEADILGKVYENFIGHIQAGKRRYKEHEDKSKRKRTGIYYTPKFIVDYIVNNTVREYIKGKPFEEILKIRILDPACGSGSFLIKAFDTLCEESVKRLGRELSYEERKNFMLNCIYGVDVDERAVVIAKLNLSLRMAERGNLLPTLRDNIRLGNSLIEDSSVAGYKAFVWKDEFKEIVKQGGFNVVIGNPPYIRVQTANPSEKEYLSKTYVGAKGKYDIYTLFIERALTLLRENGVFSFIVPNKFTQTKYGEDLKEYILRNYTLSQFIDFGDLRVFKEVTTYPCIVVIKRLDQDQKIGRYVRVKQLTPEILQSVSREIERGHHEDEEFTCFKFRQQDLNKENWSFLSGELRKIYDKISRSSSEKLSDITDKNIQGFITGDNDSFIFGPEETPKIESALFKKIPKARNVQKYALFDGGYRVLYTNAKDKAPLSLSELQRYPKTYQYLKERSSTLKKRKFFGKQMSEFEEWWQLVHPLDFKYFEQPKIITPNLSSDNRFVFDEEGFFIEHDCYIITLKDKGNYKFVVALLNSKAVEFFFKQTSPMFSGGYYKYHTQYLNNIPIPKAEERIKVKIIDLVDDIIQATKQLLALSERKPDEKAALEKKIGRLDAEINEVVYTLYGITNEEKKIIEESLQ